MYHQHIVAGVICYVCNFGGFFGVAVVSRVTKLPLPLQSLVRHLFTLPGVLCGLWLQVLLPQQGRANRLFVKARV